MRESIDACAYLFFTQSAFVALHSVYTRVRSGCYGNEVRRKLIRREQLKGNE